MIHWLIGSSFSSESSRHCLSKTVRAGELKFWENVYPPTMCHMSRVTCHMSCVFFYFVFGQSGGASQWRVCYQRGLPSLVFILTWFWFTKVLWFTLIWLTIVYLSFIFQVIISSSISTSIFSTTTTARVSISSKTSSSWLLALSQTLNMMKTAESTTLLHRQQFIECVKMGNFHL